MIKIIGKIICRLGFHDFNWCVINFDAKTKETTEAFTCSRCGFAVAWQVRGGDDDEEGAELRTQILTEIL